jgi:hypothetical protein
MFTHDDTHIHKGTLGSLTVNITNGQARLTQNQNHLWALVEKLFSKVSTLYH